MKKNTFTLILIALCMLLLTGSIAENNLSDSSSAMSDIRSTTMISEIFGDGQKITYIALEYPGAVDSASVSPEKYTVEGRTVVNAFVSDHAGKTDQSTDGNFVILQLNVMSPTINFMLNVPDGRPDMRGNVIETVPVTQTGEITGTDGTVYAPGDAPEQKGGMGPSGIHLVRDDFETDHWFGDPENGFTVHYALYKPQAATDDEKLPLVVFISHQTADDPENDPYVALAQGDGAIAWARKDFQQDHPCFVCTVLLQEKLVNDYFEYKAGVNSLIGMVDDLVKKYPIDAGRIYLSGQSNGGMTTFLMAALASDRFAALFQVASQWDPALLAETISDKPIFMVVSEADTKAPMYCDQFTDLLEANGTAVTRAVVSGQSTPEEFEKAVNSMLSEGNHINYLKLAAGTVRTELDGTPITVMGGADHMGTWKVAYDIPGIKEWIYEQKLN